MAEPTTAVVLWQNLSAALHAAQQFGKLVQAVSMSWNVLQTFLNRSQRQELQVKKLRNHLKVIARALREAHFAVGEHSLLPPGDFLAQELAAVLAAVEKACADPKLYELEVVVEKAAFIRERVTDKLQTFASAASMTQGCSSEALILNRTLATLSANSLLVSNACLADSSGACGLPGPESASNFQPLFPHLFEQLSPAAAEDYESAAESESEWETAQGGDHDDGYVSCDEIAFWDKAHRYWLGRGDCSAQQSDGSGGASAPTSAAPPDVVVC